MFTILWQLNHLVYDKYFFFSTQVLSFFGVNHYLDFFFFFAFFLYIYNQEKSKLFTNYVNFPSIKFDATGRIATNLEDFSQNLLPALIWAGWLAQPRTQLSAWAVILKIIYTLSNYIFICRISCLHFSWFTTSFWCITASSWFLRKDAWKRSRFLETFHVWEKIYIYIFYPWLLTMGWG